MHNRPDLAKVYLVVQVRHWVPSGPRYAKSIEWSMVYKGYLVAQGIQRVLRNPRYVRGT